ncbi:UEV-domain-containing protein [Lentinula aciculospora]|uniref:UEV-domain-containing protein n=1 Tax=Lentinula aciculospora TaxID=153920 RepID=A0A9W9DUE1_9AGAR|nr:UEV-domain-containing protein [Lentinula aciculospora]
MSTQKWLLENCIKYEEKEKVYNEVNTALETFGLYGRSNGWLKVKSDVYTYDDGRTHLLLCLHGLLPINYRNSTYHIPFDMWIPFNYPRGPPIVYVVPAQGMMVKNSKFVELSGRCDVASYEGTKCSWLDKGEKRTGERTGLVGLIDALIIWFGKDPPVYSRATSSPQSTPAVRSQPVPSQNHTGPPPPPSFANHVGPPPPTYSPPPAPPRHASISSASWTPQPPPIFQARSAVPMHPIMSPASWTPSPPPPPPRIQFAPTHSIPIQSSPVPAPAPVPPPNLLDSDEPASQTEAVPSPAPPLPPNPILLSLHSSVHAKITTALQSLQTSLHHSSEHLRKMQQDLLRGEPAIQDEIARLEAVKGVSLNVGGRLRQTVEAAERNVQVLRDKGDVSVDELICGPTIVHNQLIDLVAEDNAIEDTIYHLHRALNSGSIDLDRFLKTTRVLAEEQFMKRALIEKIQAGLPLGEQAMWG